MERERQRHLLYSISLWEGPRPEAAAEAAAAAVSTPAAAAVSTAAAAAAKCAKWAEKWRHLQKHSSFLLGFDERERERERERPWLGREKELERGNLM